MTNYTPTPAAAAEIANLNRQVQILRATNALLRRADVLPSAAEDLARSLIEDFELEIAADGTPALIGGLSLDDALKYRRAAAPTYFRN